MTDQSTSGDDTFRVLAREKYDEAQYFLSKMRKSRGKREFSYNLSAFLSAARSITLFLQKQFGDDERFEQWYEKK